jgi:hypothetical protein
MSGRGDKNQRGSAGRGASNQSNQPINKKQEKRASNHTSKGKPAKPDTFLNDQRSYDPDAHRNVNPADNTRPIRSDSRTLDLLVDEVPYIVKAEPFTFNDELRFYVTINDGPPHVFTWDSEVGGLRAIDDGASTLPDALEEAISARLQQK